MWRPVLAGELAARARAFVAAAVAELARRDLREPSLGFGIAGVAMLHGYRARAGEPEAAELAVDTLAAALARVTDAPWPWLFRGYAGLAFALHHLADVVGDNEDTVGELDELITSTLATEPWTHEWELQFGAIGLGVHGVERGAPAIVARVVHHLDRLAEPAPGGAGLAWRTFDPGETIGQRIGHRNLGMAHGLAGVVGFLAEVARMPAPPPRTLPLLRGAVQGLRAEERPAQMPSFAMTLGRAQPTTYQGILDGWCYGEPSTALVLVRAGEALGDPAVIDAGHALARRAARRTPAELATLDLDWALCHGSSGRAHIFHRLGVILDDAELLACATTWYARTLELADLATIPEAGLQTGLAGIALGVLGGYADTEPAWARMFLLR